MLKRSSLLLPFDTQYKQRHTKEPANNNSNRPNLRAHPLFLQQSLALRSSRALPGGIDTSASTPNQENLSAVMLWLSPAAQSSHLPSPGGQAGNVEPLH